MRNLLHFAIPTTPGSDANMAGRVTAACRICCKIAKIAISRIWLTLMQSEGTDPGVQTSGDAYFRADHMPIQDNHKTREDLLCV